MKLDYDLESLQQMRNAVTKAKEAQQRLQTYSQDQIDRIVRAMAEAAYRHSEELAELAVKETGLGILSHKVIKNQIASRDVMNSIIDLSTVGIINEDKERQVIEVASPFGVIAGITPVTNPTSTAIFKSLIAVKSSNAIVFSPHPSATHCTIAAAKICLKAAVMAGAPEGLIGWISTPTLQVTDQLMKHNDINLILSTGGGGLVKAAYSSGKPAYGVGPGNVPVYIEKTAEIVQAVSRITASKTFDNGTICASEQAIIVDKNIKELVAREFRKAGAYFLNNEEKFKVGQLISSTPGKLNPSIVGKHATTIASMCSINVPQETQLLIAYETEVGREYPFSIEKLSPVFAMYTVSGMDEALELSGKLLSLGGKGHTLAIHTSNQEVAKTFALRMPVSRIIINTPAALGAIGGTTGLRPSLTLGCGTFGGNISSDNISVEHLFNRKRLAFGTKEYELPSYETAKLPFKPTEEGKPRGFLSIEQEHVDQIMTNVLLKLGKDSTISHEIVQKKIREVLSTF
jgi:acetaldehyde dehydrogenase (acetylating)